MFRATVLFRLSPGSMGIQIVEKQRVMSPSQRCVEKKQRKRTMIGENESHDWCHLREQRDSI